MPRSQGRTAPRPGRGASGGLFPLTVKHEAVRDLTFFAGASCLWHSGLSPVHSPEELGKLPCLPDLEAEELEGSLVRLLWEWRKQLPGGSSEHGSG